jgi:hypothetical protein
MTSSDAELSCAGKQSAEGSTKPVPQPVVPRTSTILWEAEGGGDKTLRFLSVVSYARQHANMNVIVLDTDEQAKLSQMLLTREYGDNVAGEGSCAALRDVMVNEAKGWSRTLSGALLAATEPAGFDDCEWTRGRPTVPRSSSSCRSS